MGIKKIVKYAIGTAIGAGIIATVYFGIYRPADKYERIRREFKHVHTQALFQHGDTNRDGIVTAAEADDLAVKVLQDKNVLQIHDGWPRYKDGSEVPIEVMTGWYRDYRPRE